MSVEDLRRGLDFLPIIPADKEPKDEEALRLDIGGASVCITREAVPGGVIYSGVLEGDEASRKEALAVLSQQMGYPRREVPRPIGNTEVVAWHNLPSR